MLDEELNAGSLGQTLDSASQPSAGVSTSFSDENDAVLRTDRMNGHKQVQSLLDNTADFTKPVEDPDLLVKEAFDRLDKKSGIKAIIDAKTWAGFLGRSKESPNIGALTIALADVLKADPYVGPMLRHQWTAEAVAHRALQHPQGIFAFIDADGGRVLVLDDIGQGGSCLVRIALHEKHGVVAYKAPKKSDDSATALRLQREASSLRLIDGEGSVRCYSHNPNPKSAGLVLEHYRGVPLAVLGDQPLSRDAVGRIGFGVALSARRAKERGISHTDISHGNVFILPGGSIGLIDYGQAKDVKQEAEFTQTLQVMGTAGSIAPETYEVGSENRGPHSDVYSLGAVIYRLTTGKRIDETVYADEARYRKRMGEKDQTLKQDTEKAVRESLAELEKTHPELVNTVLWPMVAPEKERCTIEQALDILRAWVWGDQYASVDEVPPEQRRLLLPPIPAPEPTEPYPVRSMFPGQSAEAAGILVRDAINRAHPPEKDGLPSRQKNRLSPAKGKSPLGRILLISGGSVAALTAALLAFGAYIANSPQDTSKEPRGETPNGAIPKPKEKEVPKRPSHIVTMRNEDGSRKFVFFPNNSDEVIGNTPARAELQPEVRYYVAGNPQATKAAIGSFTPGLFAKLSGKTDQSALDKQLQQDALYYQYEPATEDSPVAIVIDSVGIIVIDGDTSVGYPLPHAKEMMEGLCSRIVVPFKEAPPKDPFFQRAFGHAELPKLQGEVRGGGQTYDGHAPSALLRGIVGNWNSNRGRSLAEMQKQ